MAGVKRHGISDRLAADLRLRVQRLVRGEHRHDDVDRLFLGHREHCGDRYAVREVGDFVAHRDQRDRGVVLEQAADVLTSIRTFIKVRMDLGSGKAPDREMIRAVAEANLRLATREQLSHRLRMTRQEAAAALSRAFRKIDTDAPVNRRERRAVDWLGGAFVWNPEFTGDTLFEDLTRTLVDHDLLAVSRKDEFAPAKTFVCLCVVTLMHGSSLLFADGCRVELIAGRDNDQAGVEVKARLTFVEAGKTIAVPLCLYWTQLKASDHCHPSLLEGPPHWTGPLDVVAGRLAPLA